MIRETVPDSFLKRADEVVNVDIPVDELRGRLRADAGDLPGAKKDFLKMSALSPSRSAEAESLIKKLKQKN